MSKVKVNSLEGVGASTPAISIDNSSGTCTANVTNNLSNRNKIINGSMVVSQRGTSTTYGGSDFKYGACDRYKIRNTSNGAFTVTQDASVFPPTFKKSLKLDVTSADTTLTGAQTVFITQFVEAQDLGDLAYGSSSAKSITISFYVRSNKTGTYAMRVQQADNGFKQAGFNYTIDSADTWERKTFTLAGDTLGVINADTGTGLEFYWVLAAGPTYQGGNVNATYSSYSNADFAAGQTVNILDNTSNEFFLTGVQVEVGTVATDFEHLSIADVLAKCQRYFYQATKIGSTSDVTNMPIAPGFYLTGSDYRAIIDFPVEMRAAPTLSSNDNSGSYYIHTNATADTIDRLDSFQNTKRRSIVRNTAHAGGTQSHFGMLHQETGDSNLNFSAEL